MTRLAPDLFDRRFDALLEDARARLPGLAPQWTDHNLHDPGITLIELLAWVTEAQMYGVARMRRGERDAYSALFGGAPRGPTPATGLVWLERGHAGVHARVVERDALVRQADIDEPAFHPSHRLLVVPGRIVALRTRLRDGRLLDHTRVNERAGIAFAPFGERAGPRDVLELAWECASDAGVFPPARATADGARWTLGVQCDTPPGSAGAPVPLEASLREGDARHTLAVIEDTSAGFTTSGAIVLDLSTVAGSPRTFTLELRAPGGFPRAPRVLHIEPNVLPIVEGREVTREPHVASGRPNETMELDVAGLRHGMGEPPLVVEVPDGAGLATCARHPDLANADPESRVFELDPGAGRLRFGNGINGQRLPAGAQVLLSYAVSRGADGAVPALRRWRVQGFDGVVGRNVDALAGAADAPDRHDARRHARASLRSRHALVTAADIEQAARALPGLGVARAHVLVPPRDPAPATVTLVAMQHAQGDEQARWLRAVERALAPRLPLGTRLVVRAPRRIDMQVQAVLELEASFDIASVAAAARKELHRRLDPQRPLGVGVSRSEVAAWLRTVPGVRRVQSLRLSQHGSVTETVAVPRHGLARLDDDATRIDIARPR